MKVIFLDNDGVICLSNNWGGRSKKWSQYRSANPESSKLLSEAPVDVRFDDFDKKAIDVLNSILEETGAEIVVSSDWKRWATDDLVLINYRESYNQAIIRSPHAERSSSPYTRTFYEEQEILENGSVNSIPITGHTLSNHELLEEAYNLHRRIIVPFYYQGNTVGYTARAIADGIKPKYYSSHPADFVFNLDTQQPDWQFVIVCEGPFDAMSIDGVALNGSEINEKQIALIKQLNRRVIVVPDADIAGRKMIKQCTELGWEVSFPAWQETCKDINAAVVKYGKLFTLKCILESSIKSKLKIELKLKGLS